MATRAVHDMLEEGLTRNDDRELFGIVPVSVAENSTA